MSAALQASPDAGFCLHCGLPAAAGERYCCTGCAGAHALVTELGLDGFYARREAGHPAQPDDLPQSFETWVESLPDGRCRLVAGLDGLTCGACVWLVEGALTKAAGVDRVRVNLTTRRLTLEWTGAAAEVDRLCAVVRRLGYRVLPMQACLDRGAGRSESELLRCMAVAGFSAMNIMLLSVSVWAGHSQGMGEATRTFLHWLSAMIALPTVAYAGRPFFRSALAALRAGRTNMDVPISVGVTLASAISVWETVHHGAHAYFDGAVMLLFFLLVGRYLDFRARGRARSAVEHLMALNSAPVTVLADGGAARVMAPADVPVGAVVLVAAGERVGVDGTVLEGRSQLDGSIVTGETAAVEAGPGTAVFAGMVNLAAPLRIATSARGEATLLAEMVRLMEVAEQGRSRFVALADRIARGYTPVVHVAALATFLGWTLGAGMGWQPALLIAVSVLIITCPCALALAVPTVQVVAAERLMKQGILLKSATALERLAAVDTVVFDKTGTLTLGRPELRPDPARPAGDLEAAARLARTSRHPLSQALARAAGPGPAAGDVRDVAGSGLGLDGAAGPVRLGNRAFCGVPPLRAVDAAAADPELWFARPGHKPLRFLFSDTLRPDASRVVADLTAQGYAVELLSGDRLETVASIAAEAGIGNWRAGATPAGKCGRLAELAGAGRRVLMVGDGLNDAPGLAAASVSMSPATAVDIAQTAADVVFQGASLAPVAETLRVARQAQALVHQNLAFSLLYNLCAVPLAISGHVTPLVAAVAMSTSSLVVMLNAFRLGLGWRKTR